MATSINGFTFTASTNNEGTFITLIAHKEDATGVKTVVFKLSPTEANNLHELIDNNCKVAKDRRKEIKKGDREEEKWPENEPSPSATPADTLTISSAPSKSGDSLASTPKKKVESSIRRSGTGVTPVGSRTTVSGELPRRTATASKPWTSPSFAPRQIANSVDNWVCEVRCSEADGDVEALVKRIVEVLNEPVPISEGRYKSCSYTELEDATAGINYSFHWTSEHPEFPGIYPLVGMLNTLDEQVGGWA